MAAAVSAAIRSQVETALVLLNAGKLEEALDVLGKPGEYTSDFYTVRGQIQFALGRFQESAGSYFTVVASEPENTFAQYGLAVCMHHLQRWAEAAQAFERVLASDPHRDDARLGLGSALLHLNRPQEALASFDLCWSDAARERALFGKAVALQKLRRFTEAQAVYERLIASQRNVEEALSNLIALSIEGHDLHALGKYSRQLLEVSPKSVTAMQGLAALALEQREFETAVRCCGRIVEQAPDCVEAWHNLRFATGQVVSTLQRWEAITAGRK